MKNYIQSFFLFSVTMIVTMHQETDLTVGTAVETASNYVSMIHSQFIQSSVTIIRRMRIHICIKGGSVFPVKSHVTDCN